MRYLKIVIALALLGILIIAGCGNRVGNNTLGATGGGENGYGYLSSSYRDSVRTANAEPSQQVEQAPVAKDAVR